MLFLRSASVDANFYPRPPRGGRPVNRAHRFAVAIFLSTPSARRATGCHQFSPPAIPYFYPRPPRGGRPASVPPRSGQGRISIHALREEGDTKTEKESAETENISIHALREEGDKRLRRWTEYNNISIHALREEGDGTLRSRTADGRNFYPRPPRGGRPERGKLQRNANAFLSTPSARRATRVWHIPQDTAQFLSTPSARRATGSHSPGTEQHGISIHALREEGDFSGFGCCDIVSISIHALREEGDSSRTRPAALPTTFLSTPSARRATLRKAVAVQQYYISIHALREEGDRRCAMDADQDIHFYPRPPRGGRHSRVAHFDGSPIFLSTPSARRATSFVRVVALSPQYFYPRPPRGGRQQKQRENPLLLSHYTPPCTNCKEVPVKQTAESHCYLCKRLVFRCEESGKTMCAACSHWRGIKRSAHYPAQTPGAAQHARP